MTQDLVNEHDNTISIIVGSSLLDVVLGRLFDAQFPWPIFIQKPPTSKSSLSTPVP